MKDIIINCPLDGRLLPLSEIDDPLFASGAMGRGIIVKNPDGAVYSPFNGEVTVLYPTKHAIALKSDDGIELLIQVGMNTFQLQGKYFDAKVDVGDKVEKDQVLIEFDPAGIKSEGYKTITPVVVTNHTEFGKITFELDGQPSITS